MKISNEVLAVLGNCTFDGPRLYLPAGQLDRKLYEAVNKVLEANGGKWNRGAKAHVFEEDAADAIEQALVTGEFHRVKQDLGQFDTPPAVVARVIELAEIGHGMSVLEPSAGRGALAGAARKAGATVACAELDTTRREILRGLGFSTASGDFLAVDPNQPKSLYGAPNAVLRFDRVVMNPPFAKQADIDHVTHALKFLKPGGRLVAIMSAGVMFRTNRKTADFRALVDRHGAQWEKLPEGAFASSGTQVNAVILAVDV